MKSADELPQILSFKGFFVLFVKFEPQKMPPRMNADQINRNGEQRSRQPKETQQQNRFEQSYEPVSGE